MQIFKRLKEDCEQRAKPLAGEQGVAEPFNASNRAKLSQNLIEFVFVLPILIFLTLVIFEVALFWQDVNSIYNLNAEINANVALLDYSGRMLGDTCPAADTSETNSAISILEKKEAMISLNNPTFTKIIKDGSEPFALYKYVSNTKINGKVDEDGSPQSQITLWVDCRNPFEDGVMTQLEFYHKTVVMKASLPRFDKAEPIVIIPDNILIASPKLNTIKHF